MEGESSSGARAKNEGGIQPKETIADIPKEVGCSVEARCVTEAEKLHNVMKETLNTLDKQKMPDSIKESLKQNLSAFMSEVSDHFQTFRCGH